MVDLRIRLRQRPQGCWRQRRLRGQVELQSWLHVRWMRLCWPLRLHHKENQERPRVCRDVLSLLTTEELRSSLRKEGLPVSGLKQDMVTRLAPSLEDIGGGGRNQRPTTRQLKYVLWLWRHQNLHGRVLMRWGHPEQKGCHIRFHLSMEAPRCLRLLWVPVHREGKRDVAIFAGSTTKLFG